MKMNSNQTTSMGCTLAAFIFSIAAAIPVHAQGVVTNGTGTDRISPAALAQINAIIAEKANRTPAEAKLDSNLLYGMRAVTQARTQGIVNGIGAQQPQFVQEFVQNQVAADTTVKVNINADVNPALLAALSAAGATEVSAFAQYGSVTARLPITGLPAISARGDVRFVGLYVPPFTHRHDMTPEELRVREEKRATLAKQLDGAIRNAGAKTSEGVAAHAADKVQQSGINGSGIKVCVLSDGVNSLAARQASGDLDAVDVVAGQAGNGDEGTAMLEIIHDMAPGAALGFATAFSTEAQMASNILSLRNAHACDIIVDDVGYYLAPAFQEGIIAQAVTSVTASGALYFSSAANSGSVSKGTSGTWEGDFVNSGTTIAAIPESGTIHSFAGANANTLTKTGNLYILSWSDPMGASGNDYDLFILNSAMTSLIAQSSTNQNGSQNPQEYISPSASIVTGSKFVVVNYQGAAQTRGLRLDTQRGRLAVNTNGNTYGHNGGLNTISVAAVSVATAGGGAFTGGTTNPVETFSSDGPRRLFYTTAGAAITSGNVLFGSAGGTLLNKVDLAAADCGMATAPGFTTFCGTSAAAPHAAAIAALIKSAKPSLSTTQIKTALTSTALDIEAGGYDYTAGIGLVMANTSVTSVLTPLGVSAAFSPSSISLGGTTTLSISLSNPNSTALSNVVFTDNYPSNLTNTGTPNAQITGSGCSGIVTAAANGNSLTLSGANIPAGGTCTVTVNTTVAFGSSGNYVNSTGTVTTPMGLNSSAASAFLSVAVVPTIPVCTLTASPGTINLGGSSNLSVSCSPAATSYAWTNTGFGATATGGNVAPASTTTYSVTGSNALGTGSASSVTVTVIQPPVPFCTLTASSPSISSGGSSTLTANCSPAPTSYTWTNTSFSSSASSGTVTPGSTSIYSVVGNNAVGSGSPALAAVIVGTAVASQTDVRTYVPAAAASTGYVSYLRVINTGSVATPVSVAVIGGSTGAVGVSSQLTPSLAAGGAVTFSAQQVETALGISLPASDRSRIRVTGAISPVETQSFLLQPGGAFNEVSAAQSGTSVTVDTYVPAAAASSGYTSYLRVINTGATSTSVIVAKIDPATGLTGSAGTLNASLLPGAAITYTATQVEAALGFPITAAERPRIVVSAGSSTIEVQSFLIQPGGAFTNVSTEQSGSSIDVRSYVPAASSGYTSFLRVINDSGPATAITASLMDDATGLSLASGTLIASLPANAATTLSSAQVEAALGTSIAAASRPRIRVSSPSGSVTLRTQSFLLQPGGAYNEISNGLTGSSVNVRTYVPAADAASGYTSYLRVINPTASTTAVTIALIDGTTGAVGSPHTLIASLPGGGAQTFSSGQIETVLGTTISAGSRPRIRVSGSVALEVQSFLTQPGGAFTEVSGGQ